MSLPMRSTANAPTRADLDAIAALNLCDVLDEVRHDLTIASDAAFRASKDRTAIPANIIATAKAACLRAVAAMEGK